MGVGGKKNIEQGKDKVSEKMEELLWLSFRLG